MYVEVRIKERRCYLTGSGFTEIASRYVFSIELTFLTKLLLRSHSFSGVGEVLVPALALAHEGAGAVFIEKPEAHLYPAAITILAFLYLRINLKS